MKPRRKGTRKPKDSHEANNRACAAIVLANPERYAGLMVEWALMIVAKAHERETPELFRGLAS